MGSYEGCEGKVEGVWRLCNILVWDLIVGEKFVVFLGGVGVMC